MRACLLRRCRRYKAMRADVQEASSAERSRLQRPRTTSQCHLTLVATNPSLTRKTTAPGRTMLNELVSGGRTRTRHIHRKGMLPVCSPVRAALPAYSNGVGSGPATTRRSWAHLSGRRPLRAGIHPARATAQVRRKIPQPGACHPLRFAFEEGTGSVGFNPQRTFRPCHRSIGPALVNEYPRGSFPRGLIIRSPCG